MGEATATWRRRLPWIVTVGSLAAMGAALLAAYVRGTTVAGTLVEPASPAEGVTCQLTRVGGSTPVRCIAIVDAPAESVWSVVTSYREFSDVFRSRLWRLDVSTIQHRDGAFRLAGALAAPGRTFPFDVKVTHREKDGERVADWSDVAGAGTSNRGSWTIRPAGAGRTRVVYQLAVAIPRIPQFLVNDVLLSALPTVVEQAARGSAAGKQP